MKIGVVRDSDGRCVGAAADQGVRMACYISDDGCCNLPKKEPKLEFAATGDSGSDGSAGAGYAENVGVDGYYVLPKEEPEPELGIGDGGAVDVNGYYDCDPPKDEPEFVDVHCYSVKEEPEPELPTTDDHGARDDYPNKISVDDYCDFSKEDQEPKFFGGNEDAVEANSYCEYGPSNEGPELEQATTGEDAVVDSGRGVRYYCSHCGISLCTQEFKVEHDLRCKAQTQRREFESQITEVHYCSYCKCPFLNKEFKEQHQQKWCRKKPVANRRDAKGTFACDDCQFVTKYKKSLDRHLLTHNKNNAEWFACTQCSYKTVYKYDMTKHTKIHGSTFSCCCPICGKSFQRKHSLDDHLLRRHSDEPDEISKLITCKVYTCDICNKFRTVMKPDFNNHVAITHRKGDGCRKYQCPCCSYSTFYKSNLKTHSKMHLEQKDYRCTVCKKEFTQKQGLDSHVLCNHADDVDLVKTITSKIHRCELCSYKTVLLTHLTVHVQSKHI